MRPLFLVSAFASVLAAASLRAQTAPVITAQPAGRTVAAGASASFSVTATGTSLSYQWSFDGSAISGATSSTYSISSVQASNAGNYAVVVSNSAGSVTSSTVNLLVYTPYVVRTLAGAKGSAGYANGSGSAALFNHPQGIAVDTSGNVYVADTANDVIRKIDASGNVSTLAGQPGIPGIADGTGAAAQFYNPTTVAVDFSGNLYVADCFNSTVRKITPAGAVTTLAGLAPTSAVPSPINQGSASGTGTAARFNEARGLAVDGAGNLWVADTYNSAVRKLVVSTAAVTTFAGNPGSTPTSTDGTGTAARFNYPFGIAADGASDLWVADTSNQTIRAVTTGAVVSTYAGTPLSTGSQGGPVNVARFNQPTGAAIDGQGNLFVADMGNSTLREVVPGGIVVTLAGLAGNTGTLDAAGTAARFTNPFGVAVDNSGNVYVADTGNNTIRIASPESASDVPPQITVQPTSQTVTGGQNVTLSVTATGTPAPGYQWQKNGVNIPGATGSALALNGAQSADSGAYDVVVSNEAATVTSNTVTLTVVTPPTISAAPQSQTIMVGANLTLGVTAAGGALNYQWFLNGTAISGANAAELVLAPVAAYEAGTYTVTVTNTQGSATTTVGTLTLTENARLLNLSARASAGAGSNLLTVGFAVSGGTKKLLLRGIGPTLANYGVPGVLAQPQLTLYPGGSQTALATAGAWGGSSTLSALFAQVGAFALDPASADSAMAQSLAPSTYTAQVSGIGGATGVALAEMYDADTGTPAGRLVNLSARANSVAGAQVLTGGFAIAGTTAETVLLRGIGPTLASFGVAGVMAHPVLTLFDSNGNVLATNSGWGGSSALSALFTRVSAFALPTTSADAAMVETLAPGTYTVQVAGASGSSGVALVEIYEVR